MSEFRVHATAEGGAFFLPSSGVGTSWEHVPAAEPALDIAA
ncbi:MAG: hypothetical protein ACRDM2_04370 [Gaiellaceae bacterium]